MRCFAAGNWSFVSTLDGGSFSSVVSDGHHTIYAASAERSELHVFKFDDARGGGGQWRRAHAWQLPFNKHPTSERLTLAVCGDGGGDMRGSIVCASWAENVVHVMSSRDGSLQQTHNGSPSPEGRSALNTPYICASHADGSLIIADEFNHCLQVMSSASGDVTTLVFSPPLSRGSRPVSAVLVDERLYVATAGDRSVHEYTQ